MQAVYRDLVPSGTLRAAINFGNALVAHREGVGGEPRGLAVDLVNELARRLSVPSSVLEFDGVVGILEAGMVSTWDLAFLAIAIRSGHSMSNRAMVPRVATLRPAIPLRRSEDT